MFSESSSKSESITPPTQSVSSSLKSTNLGTILVVPDRNHSRLHYTRRAGTLSSQVRKIGKTLRSHQYTTPTAPYHVWCTRVERKFRVKMRQKQTSAQNRPHQTDDTFKRLRASIDNLGKAYGKVCVSKALKGSEYATHVKAIRVVSEKKRIANVRKPSTTEVVQIKYENEEKCAWRRLTLLAPDGVTKLRFRMHKDAPMLVAMLAICKRFGFNDMSAMQLILSRMNQLVPDEVEPIGFGDTITKLGLLKDDMIMVRLKQSVPALAGDGHVI